MYCKSKLFGKEWTIYTLTLNRLQQADMQVRQFKISLSILYTEYN